MVVVLKIIVQNLQKQSGLASRVIAANVAASNGDGEEDKKDNNNNNNNNNDNNNSTPPPTTVTKTKQTTTTTSTHYDDLILLAQEINLSTEESWFQQCQVNYTSKSMGYGTAIYSQHAASSTNKNGGGSLSLSSSSSSLFSNIRRIDSPNAEVGGLFRKKTIVATYQMIPPSTTNIAAKSSTTASSTTSIVELISFHGYNGQPFKNVSKLVDHVNAVLAVIATSGPAIFAGDFNTWTQQHVNAVSTALQGKGFQKVYSWPYPGREIPLDHVFMREMTLVQSEPPPSYYSNESDHNGAILYVSPLC